MRHPRSRTSLLTTAKTLLASLTHASAETTLLQDSIHALIKLLRVKYGAIALLDEQGDLGQFVHTCMDTKETGLPPEAIGLLGAFIRENAVLRLDDMAGDPRSAGFPPDLPKMTSLLAVPISDSERVHGKIYLCDKFDKTPFSDEDEDLALSFANALSLILSNARKVDRLEQDRSQLVQTAFHDPLTRLPNRTLLRDRIGQALCHAIRSQTRVAILFCDLDGFKAVNDTLGHEAGDHVLKTMGERFTGCVRGDDTVARIGGDEFVLVLSEIESFENTGTVAKKILDTISERIVFDGHEIKLSGSIGIAVYPLDGETMESLLKNADTAMYQAKKNGKNKYRFYADSSLADAVIGSRNWPPPVRHANPVS